MDDSTAETTQTMPPWWQRLTSGLKRSSSALGGAIAHVVAKRQLDEATIEEIEDALIRADLGAETAGRIATELRYGRFNTAITADEIKEVVAAEVEKALAGVAQPLNIDPAKRPFVILVAGVNGSGKTTTIGKLAARLRRDGRSVMLAAGDTFRAAAADQLELWAQRTGGEIVRSQEGADPGSVVFDAIAAATSRGADLVLVDTAGRLHTKVNLMEELKKLRRIVDRTPGACKEVLLVIDASTGQNGLVQAKQFAEAVDVTGIVLTKLDGTAKGGIVLAIQSELDIPVKVVGVGEGVGDLIEFDPKEFAAALFSADD